MGNFLGLLNRFYSKECHGQPAAGCFDFCLMLLPEGLKFGYVNIVLAMNMGDLGPGTGHLVGGRPSD